MNVSLDVSGGRDRLSSITRTPAVSPSFSVATSSAATVPATLHTTVAPIPPSKSVSLNASAVNLPSVRANITTNVSSGGVSQAPSMVEQGSFSLAQGALSVDGLVNTTSIVSLSGIETATTPTRGDPSSSVPMSPPFFDDKSHSDGTTELVTDNDAQSIFNPINEPSLAEQIVSPSSFFGESEQTSPPIFTPYEGDPEETKRSRDENVEELIIEQQVLAQLAKRDAEVRAHEQAHASVGGSLAQSPRLSYEQGSDGRRYAVDGEVSIDISVVAGNPLATVNKMRQVYAAAMAPSNPSIADIQVAAEAMKKLNQAKAELVSQRQQAVPSIEEMAPLLGAQSVIDGIPVFDPPEVSIAGQVDETGAISKPQAEDINPVNDTIGIINRQLTSSVLDISSNGYLSSTVSGKYDPVPSAVSSINFSI
ncbi:hypothetical protein HQQ94_11905 [Shewanella sp. VB17]|uniref:putative metalloprotease CJM1_0395 family protein n=1 Tax=Shewanella sp. VB17 TaxID=2739432 RepID=UPI001563B51D|nr:putative metalloprotease CJM1_0395 family protein [Shewanella sp. VB17]NRD73926.1 hypothetical protein [Shewanella sp. VB17]